MSTSPESRSISAYPWQRKLPIAIAAWTALLVLSALIGVARAYSPVPFWDMWDGYLWFFLQVSGGHPEAWWVPHNEHRIVLSHLLFWLDLRYLGGAGWSLVVANCLLVGATAWLFYRMLRARAGTPAATPGQRMLGLGLTGWLFSWMQHENLTWGFQSQFILAQLLPLCAVYWLYKSADGDRPLRHFLMACLFGLASIGTMANGILALPLMCAYAVYLRQGPLRIGTLLLLSCAAVALYFHGYHAPPAHGSLSTALRTAPLDLLRYILYYLGAPFYFLVGGKGLGRLAAIVASCFFLLSAARFARFSWRQPVKDKLALALLLFVLYIVGTAVGTAGGRLIFGASQAFNSRYTTPTLMAWAALLLLYAPALLATHKVWNRRAVLPFALVAILLAVVQLPAWRSQQTVLTERKLATLALAMEVKDQIRIGAIYPAVDRALEVAQAAALRRLSVLGMYPYAQMKAQMGAVVAPSDLPSCQGGIDSAQAIAGDSRYLLVRGSVWIAASRAAPQLVRFIDQQQRVAGYALVETGGQIRPGPVATASAVGPLPYTGYVLASGAGGLTMLGEHPGCQLRLIMPPAV